MGANRSQVPGGGVAGPPSSPTPTLPSAPAAAPSLSSSARVANGLGPTRRAAAQRSHAMGPRKAASTTATTKTPIAGTASAPTGNGPLPPPDAVPFWSDDRSYGVQSTTTGDIFMTYPGFRANRPSPQIPGATGPFSSLNTTSAAPPGKRKEKDVGTNNRPLAGNKTRSNAIIPPLSDFGGVGGAGGKNSMSMPSGSIDPMGDSMSLDGMSDTSERSRDGRHDGQSGKKRKVPSSLQTLGRDEAARDLDGQLHEDDPLDGDVDDQFEPNEGEEPSASRSRPNAAQGSGGGAGGTGSGKELYIDNGDTGDRGDQDYHTRSSTGNNGTAAFPRKFGRWTIRDPPRSRAALACGWKKALFLKRKAALITLFLDAQTAINQTLTAKLPANADAKSTAVGAGRATVNDKGKDKPSVILPEVEVFEAMMPALEDIGVGQWPLDQPGWRTGVEVRDETRVQLEKWRTTYDRRRRELAGRKKVVRGGWAPEGSFEFEVNSKPSRVAQSRAKDHASLRKLIVELRAVTLNATKLASVQKTHAQIHDKTQRQPARGDHGGAGTGVGRQAVSGQIESMVTTSGPTHQSGNANANKDGARDANRDTGADKENVPMSSNGSSHGSEETTTGSGKKKQKKKKRSVLANQSNPHHVDNYRPSRIPGTHGDPLEPYPWHDNLLFPPSMAFLSARPASRTRSDDVQVDAAGVAPMTVRPAEDDYLCTFCEYALYYGTEAERKRAIRMRRRELKRKQTIKNRARNVAEGKGKGNLGREEEDEEEWDEEDECEDGDGCTGRCS